MVMHTEANILCDNRVSTRDDRSAQVYQLALNRFAVAGFTIENLKRPLKLALEFIENDKVVMAD